VRGAPAALAWEVFGRRNNPFDVSTRTYTDLDLRVCWVGVNDWIARRNECLGRGLQVRAGRHDLKRSLRKSADLAKEVVGIGCT